MCEQQGQNGFLKVFSVGEGLPLLGKNGDQFLEVNEVNLFRFWAGLFHCLLEVFSGLLHRCEVCLTLLIFRPYISQRWCGAQMDLEL